MKFARRQLLKVAVGVRKRGERRGHTFSQRLDRVLAARGLATMRENRRKRAAIGPATKRAFERERAAVGRALAAARWARA